MARRTAPQASFDDQLVLFRYFLHELKIDSLGALSEKLNSAEYEGFNESGGHLFLRLHCPHQQDEGCSHYTGEASPL